MSTILVNNIKSYTGDTVTISGSNILVQGHTILGDGVGTDIVTIQGNTDITGSLFATGSNKTHVSHDEITLETHSGSIMLIVDNNSGNPGDVSELVLSSSITTGRAIHIDATAHSSSILDIDAGTLDIDASGAATLTALEGVAIGAGSGELDLTTTSTLDINSNTLNIDNKGTVQMYTSASYGHIIISSSHTAGIAIQLKCDHDAGSILDIDAGILDIDALGSIDINSGDNITVDAADDILLTTTSADGLLYLSSSHTAGQAIHINATANAGSILDIDAGILDIDVTGATTIDADSIMLTGAVTAVNGVQNATVAIEATDNGSGNGTIPAGTATALVNANSDANHIVILPAPVVGNIIHIIENGTTGYELRSTDPTSIAINGGTASGGESAVAGTVTYLKCVCVSSTSWIVSQFDADGDESKLEAAA